MRKISVIIPVFNSEKYLKRCIESVLNQTYSNIEIIVINDGSTDDSKKIIEELKEKNKNIRLFSQQNKGQSAARNLGMEIAQGEYIGFVDSDDWIHPQMFSHLVKILEDNQADISSGQMITLRNDEKKGYKDIVDYNLEIEYREQSLVNYLYNGQNKKNGQYSAARKLFRKEVLENVRFEEGYIYEDMLFNFEALENSQKHVASDAIVYYYYIDNQSTMRSQFREKDFDLIVISDKIMERVKNYPHQKRLLELAKMKKARDYFTLLIKLTKNGTTIDSKKIPIVKKKLVKGLRENYWLLIKSPLKPKAKLTATILAINFKGIDRILS